VPVLACHRAWEQAHGTARRTGEYPQALLRVQARSMQPPACRQAVAYRCGSMLLAVHMDPLAGAARFEARLRTGRKLK